MPVRILSVDNRGSETNKFGYIYFESDVQSEGTRLPYAQGHAFTHRDATPYWRKATREEYLAARNYLKEKGYISG